VSDRAVYHGRETAGLEERLAVACAITRALVGRSDPEALQLIAESRLPTAIFDRPGAHPRLDNVAWRGLFAELPEALAHAIEAAANTDDLIHVPEVRVDTEARLAFCAVTVRADPDSGLLICVAAVLTDDVISRELAVPGNALVCAGRFGGGTGYLGNAWRNYTGVPSDWRATVDPRDLAACDLAISAATQRRVAIDAGVVRVDGSTRLHQISFAPVAGGRWWIAAALDVEDARATEAERAGLLAREREARAEAERANRLKDRFLMVVSHELRAPMTTILLWEKILRAADTEPELFTRALDVIHQSVVSQSRVVGDLLDVSRAISGKLFVDRRPVELVNLTREAIDAIAPVARAKRVSVEPHIVPCGTVTGDSARLRQVLDNLLANAVKFTPGGGKVTVRLSTRARVVTLSIEDTGPGIAADLLLTIFEPFTQGNLSETRVSGGLGLGLAIAHELVELHDGTLTATSPGPGLGATFTLTLPTAGRARAASSTLRALAPRLLDGVRVLVVDDDVRVRDALSVLLGRAGAVVEAADSAPAARERLIASVPDALVCDIAMPHESGYELLTSLRASGVTLPAIAVTAYATSADARRAFEAGFDRHVPKPVDVEQLVACIAELVTTRGHSREAQ
jgi:signal transduction histidine kinase/ActR/RegA family two-component response regulator